MKSGKIYIMKNVREEEMKKYAIYSAETGLYYYQYADTIELLEGTGFENIITEEQLPVVFDGTTATRVTASVRCTTVSFGRPPSPLIRVRT